MPRSISGYYYSPAAGDIHFVSAGLMFIFLAWMAIRFTNTDSPQPTPQKRLRNLIYKICAIKDVPPVTEPAVQL